MADRKVYVNHDLKDNVAVGFGVSAPNYANARFQVTGTANTDTTHNVKLLNSSAVELLRVADGGRTDLVPTVGQLNIGNVNVFGAMINAKGRGNTDSTKIADFRNSSGNQILQVTDAANMVIGVGNYLTNTRLYVHAINTTLQYGLNARIASTRSGSVWNQMEVNAQTSGAAAYNYFNAISNSSIARGIWGNAQSTTASTNQGVYSYAQAATGNNYAFYGQVSGATNPTGADYGMYLLMSGANTDDKYGTYIDLQKSAVNGNRTGHLLLTSSTADGANTTGFKATIASSTITNNTNLGLYLDVTGIGAGTTNRAIHTVGGDVRIEDLSSTTSNIVTADTTGVLKTDTIPTVPVYTVATLPTVVVGGIIIVTDEVGGSTMAIGVGANWLRVSDGSAVA